MEELVKREKVEKGLLASEWSREGTTFCIMWQGPV